jgi:S-adenosylmethionine synthetase
MTSQLYPAESIFPGHPDKICDAIADSLVAEAVRRQSRALCGLEVAVHRGSVFLTGRIACRDAETIPIDSIVRDCFRTAGYDSEWGPVPEDIKIVTDLCLGPLSDSESNYRKFSDDQSIVTGYAIESPGTNYLPPEHWLACRLSARLRVLRELHPDLRLGPDGKVVIVWDAAAKALSQVSVSLQQSIGADEIGLHRAVRQAITAELRECAPSIPGLDPQPPEIIHVNGAGNFEVGGTEGDNGLSGKKLVVDAYGPRVPIGGGALSGKDFYKADRAGAILARRLAKTVVQTGIASECLATLAIFPGDPDFRLLSLKTPGAELDPARWAGLFDLSLESAGNRYATTSDLAALARFGHFIHPEHPWERLILG